MAMNYKHQYESMKKMVTMYQDEIVPGLWEKIKELEKQMPRWIPVSERLPDNRKHDWVLAQIVEDNGYMHIPKVMEYRQALNDWYEETYGWLSKHNGAFFVTHWMPLPEPPKENDNG